MRGKAVGRSVAIWPANGRRCFGIMLLIRLEILHPSQSVLFSWQVSGYLPHKSLNIGCYIKAVTNQADGERCHQVSILQGRCLSLRKPAPSALTSSNPAHARTACTCCGAHATCAREHIHAFMGSDVHVYITHTHTCMLTHQYISHWERMWKTPWFNGRPLLMRAD